ncbi:hypothetical protein DFJ77DRAFT_439087 [Powellomyces hirtus]|nr:hypothetical protein DFJ77DRAFT_439087 [Powellomyces hirtus]
MASSSISLSAVPIELKRRICEWLDPRAAFGLRQVTRVWNHLLSDRTLWRKKVHQYERITSGPAFICQTNVKDAKEVYNLDRIDLHQIKCIFTPRSRKPSFRTLSVLALSYAKHGGIAGLAYSLAKTAQTVRNRFDCRAVCKRYSIMLELARRDLELRANTIPGIRTSDIAHIFDAAFKAYDMYLRDEKHLPAAVDALAKSRFVQPRTFRKVCVGNQNMATLEIYEQHSVIAIYRNVQASDQS